MFRGEISLTILSVLWSFVQRVGGITISFVSNVILARILFPEDFGIIGLILVFSSLADTLVDAGLGSALIQKEKITKQDISTVFSANILFSLFLFAVFFISAPLIANFVEVKNFDIYLRIQIITIILRALYVTEFSILNKKLRFKDLAKINILSSLLSAIIAIVLAYLGYGVWSLIIKNISLQIFLVVLYKLYIRTSVNFSFDKKSFSELLNFGGFVSLTYLLDFIYSNTISLLLGKKYSLKDLGYYTQANSIRQIPINTLSLVVAQVMFPMFSKFQNDSQRVIESMGKLVRFITFFIFPALAFLILFAEPIVVLLFSSKWLPSAKIFQILCFGGLVNALIHANRNVLKSLGFSKLLFIAEIISVLIGFSFLIIGLNYNLNTLLVLIAFHSFINFFILGIFVHIKLKYFFWNQIKDLSINAVFSIVSIFITFIISICINLNNFLYLLINSLIFIFTYYCLHFVFKTKSLALIMNIFLKK